MAIFGCGTVVPRRTRANGWHESATRYLPIPGWALGSALVFVSVSVTLRTVFTAEIRLGRVLGGRMGGASRKASATNPITASTTQNLVLLLMPVTGPLFHRMVVTCFRRCQSELYGLVCPSANCVGGSRSL